MADAIIDDAKTALADNDQLEMALHAAGEANDQDDDGGDIAADDVGASKLAQEVGKEGGDPKPE